MNPPLLILALVAASFSAAAQQPALKAAAATTATAAPAGYTDMMAATITELNSTGDPAQLQQIVSKFERAAAAMPTDWLPQYYQAYGRMLISFQGKDKEEVKDKYLDQAEASLAQARKLGGEESELLVLQAYIHQARLGISPMARSMKYSGLVREALEQAKKANPANPRIYLVEGNNLYFTPKMFGGGPDVAKPVFEQALARYAAFKPATPLMPTWGERQVQSRLKSYAAQPAAAPAPAAK
ncbi:hypothetical protein [Hymenobacter cellulosilyticus]|uniref:Tetratricopeptide repeat protein n=1 Tax=Hymenobacter cellulosilyticus TaxID=2932248 RepID=A0A8T9Q242_9BACT|nr:hypothetical protein [Hymenobacter cellulosilyticus]UOQ71806.1 hypothetical protein MUN79_24920 [Hymenobacter cellulosilyticus]